MATAFLVTLITQRSLYCGIVIFVAWMLFLSSSAQAQIEQAEVRQDLRLYRINKDGIASRFWFTRGKARKTGCQNIRKRSRLHRAVQFGYAKCSIYTKKDCAADTIVSFTRKDDLTPTTELLQGYSWFTVSEHSRGVRIKSWRCEEIPS